MDERKAGLLRSDKSLKVILDWLWPCVGWWIHKIESGSATKKLVVVAMMRWFVQFIISSQPAIGNPLKWLKWMLDTVNSINTAFRIVLPYYVHWWNTESSVGLLQRSRSMDWIEGRNGHWKDQCWIDIENWTETKTVVSEECQSHLRCCCTTLVPPY